MSNANKNYPSHKVWFSDNEIENSNGVEVGVVWPRKSSKKGGILKWGLSPQILGSGVWRLLNNLLSGHINESQFAKTYTLSFSQKMGNTNKLGRAVKVAIVDEEGFIHWSISPEKLSEDGVLFVLADGTPKVQSEASE